eukprot:3934090-Pyramimonas_sp.AAC.1
MACPWERGTDSNVCAVLRPMMLMLLPMSKRIVRIPSTMVPLCCQSQFVAFSEYSWHFRQCRTIRTLAVPLLQHPIDC